MKRAKLSWFPKVNSWVGRQIYSDGSNLEYRSPYLCVYGPCTEEMIGRKGASAAWTMVAAGLQSEPEEQDWNSRSEPGYYGFRLATANAASVMEALLAVSPIASEDSIRNYATVIKLDTSYGAVATDGFRLAWQKCPIEKEVSVRKAEVTVLAKFYKAFGCQEISLSEDETTILFRMGPYRLYVRPGAVKYPNFSGVLPKYTDLQDFPASEYANIVSSFAAKLKAAKKSELIKANILGSNFNARFLSYLPDPETVEIGRGETPSILKKGSLSYVVVPIMGGAE